MKNNTRIGWAERLYNNNKPLQHKTVCEGCIGVIEKIKTEKADWVSYLSSSIKQQDRSNKKAINIRLDLISVFNEFQLRKTAKMLFLIVDSYITKKYKYGLCVATKKELISKSFKRIKCIQKYRSAEIDEYFNKILNDEDTLMQVDGTKELFDLLKDRGVTTELITILNSNSGNTVSINL